MSGELHVVILAAGEGKRMRSRHPKVLHPVAGRPMLEHVIAAVDTLECAGIHVVVGHAADELRILLEAIGHKRLSTVEQRQRLGTGHAVQQAIDQIPGSARVLVLPGDMPLIRPETLQRLCRLDAALAILSFIADDPTGYGRILRDDQQRVTGIREQRDASTEQAAIREVNSGVLLADAGPLSDWLSRIDNRNRQGEYYLTDVVELAAGEGVEIESICCADAGEALGANTMAQLAVLEAALQRR
ncbi:MAG: NTP transferase domain-containing protein, partial [Xanthomonadaceae bacterium]|nr:NTP transferase domain-containing protein [Xanthomonadaceae bacterium]